MLWLRCGAAELRLAGSADDDLLVALLPDDFDHDPTFPREPGSSLAEHRERWLRSWLGGFRALASGDRFLPFVVSTLGRPVGSQVLEGRGFDHHREVDSSSFLVADARGQGLGVAMRTAILTLAFERLGAERAISAARPANVASRRVSEKVDYLSVGRRVPVVAGRRRPIDCYELTRARWTTLPRASVEIIGDATWDAVG